MVAVGALGPMTYMINVKHFLLLEGNQLQANWPHGNSYKPNKASCSAHAVVVGGLCRLLLLSTRAAFVSIVNDQSHERLREGLSLYLFQPTYDN
ncbi:MAG: hypothetical protein EOP06_19535 [Proteobacteria bacterium]|nr:MAG: hypothetical protein EOP06_19535 [Pseudomonadota bacterium]